MSPKPAKLICSRHRTLGFRTARRSTLQPYLSSIDRAKLKELLTQTGPAAVAKAMGICVINRLQAGL